jgi:uncharacterized protein YeaO (DUF488 family)
MTRSQVVDPPVLARVYDPPDQDRFRVLVHGLWPRGLSRPRAALDEWLREIAPSAALRGWYRHDVEKFEDFTDCYHDEFTDEPRAAALAAFTEHAHTRPVVVLTATRDNRAQPRGGAAWSAHTMSRTQRRTGRWAPSLVVMGIAGRPSHPPPPAPRAQWPTTRRDSSQP